jgi:hypothetical protein
MLIDTINKKLDENFVREKEESIKKEELKAKYDILREKVGFYL